MNVLIIGKNSYIGDHICHWLSTSGWRVYQLDVLNEDWRLFDFSLYDVIVHVAGIVHRPNCHDWNMYKCINVDMPVEIAKMAKSASRVKTYIFLSSMAVYGKEKELKPNVINKGSTLHASSMYGKSKLIAEEELLRLQDESFDIVIIRPPSVYGKGCRGGYISGFSSFVRKMPIVPVCYQGVKQSLLYIDNLCELIRLIIVHNLKGVFCPQDDKAVSANEILNAIASGLGHKAIQSYVLGFLVKCIHFFPIIKKAYGGVQYSMELSKIKGIDYVVVPFEEGMKRTVS